MTTKSEKKKIVVLTLLLLIGAGVLASLLALQPDSHDGRNATREAGELDRGARSDSQRELDKRSDPVTDVAVIDAQVNVPESSAMAVKEPPVALVTVLSPDGWPVVGCALEWRSPKAAIMAADGIPVQTDADGKVELELTEPSRIRLYSNDDHWGLEVTFEVGTGSQAFKFTAMPLGQIEILAMCDNGQPYVGRGSVESGRIDPDALLGFKTVSRGYRNGFHMDGLNPVVLSRVPLGQDLRVGFVACMIGYSEQSHFIESSRLADGGRFLITLAADPKQQGGILEFDWTGYEAKQMSASITKPGSKVVWGGGVDRNGPPYRSELLPPGEYVLRIAGKPGWESPVFEIKAREITSLAFAVVPRTKVSVTVVDEDGAGIAGALFMRDHAVYPNLDDEFRTGPRAAVSNAIGRAELADVPLGSQTFLVEARGFEPQLITQEVAEGDPFDLGTVVLKPARGKITVTLTGMADKQSYCVMVMQPGGAAVRILKGVTTDRMVFENLPARTYIVAVIPGKGGDAASAAVEVTEATSTHDVVLDVFGLRERSVSAK